MDFCGLKVIAGCIANDSYATKYNYTIINWWNKSYQVFVWIHSILNSLHGIYGGYLINYFPLWTAQFIVYYINILPNIRTYQYNKLGRKICVFTSWQFINKSDIKKALCELEKKSSLSHYLVFVWIDNTGMRQFYWSI